ncbi:MAG: peptidoglycan DD-metalloendopeptidase family protein [Syntrophales bacterium]
MNRKNVFLVFLTALIIITLGLKTTRLFHIGIGQTPATGIEELRAIHDKVVKGETLLAIFLKHGLDVKDLYAMRDAAARIYPLRNIHAGQPYTAKVEGKNRLNTFVYQINPDSVLKIRKTATSFEAKKEDIPYEKKLLFLSGNIEDNLISSIGQDHEHLLLALQLSDIFAWNIDFAVDLRKNDSYRIIAEGLFLNGKFRRYGNIVAAEFDNNGEHFKAYHFEHDGKADYYDEEGRSLQRVFLKAPLNFRRISSYFSQGRLHPILKIRRPHNGIDYAAASGTPVSAVGGGKVIYSAWKGAYGNLIIIRHPNGWETYYGHLSKISPGIKKGRNVEQGQIIGNVGSTGLATGPHLHYEFRIDDKPVNPLKVKIPEGWPIPANELVAFNTFRDRMDSCFSNPRDLQRYAVETEKSGINRKSLL